MSWSLFGADGVCLGRKGDAGSLLAEPKLFFLAFSCLSALKNMSRGDLMRANGSGVACEGGEGDCKVEAPSWSRRACMVLSGAGLGTDLEANFGMGKDEAAGELLNAALAYAKLLAGVANDADESCVLCVGLARGGFPAVRGFGASFPEAAVWSFCLARLFLGLGVCVAGRLESDWTSRE